MDDEQLSPYAVILIEDGAEIGRVLFMAGDTESAEDEADGILNNLVGDRFPYEDFVIVRLEGAEAEAALVTIGEG